MFLLLIAWRGDFCRAQRAADPSDDTDSSEYEERLFKTVLELNGCCGEACEGVLSPEWEGGGGLAGGSDLNDFN